MQLRFPWFTLNARPAGRPVRCLAAMLAHEALHLVGVDPHRPGAPGYRQTVRYAIGAPDTYPARGQGGSRFVIADGDTFPAVVDDATLIVTNGASHGSSASGAVIAIYRGNVSTNSWEAWPLTLPAGTPRLRAFSVAYNDPDILTGVTLFTPVVGDILLNAWIEVLASWTAVAFGDIGSFTDGHGWYYASQNGAAEAGVEMEELNTDAVPGAQGLMISSFGRGRALASGTADGGNGQISCRVAPGRFTSADPIKFVVTSNGSTSGTDPGSAAGLAVIYIQTCEGPPV